MAATFRCLKFDKRKLWRRMGTNGTERKEAVARLNKNLFRLYGKDMIKAFGYSFWIEVYEKYLFSHLIDMCGKS